MVWTNEIWEFDGGRFRPSTWGRRCSCRVSWRRSKVGGRALPMLLKMSCRLAWLVVVVLQ